ncbi:insulin receptor substrate 1-like isoform X3 [Ctenocephalides felis]|uniref:insulin receptor substrate 1-like isoform X3 n=1 Tax=Ctenocephalides felis TaxID=7515 RepID=UPI000E6E547B|nr:insulin receptor substrate 1-like isoform X3 [Ctenocephalides felis]
MKKKYFVLRSDSAEASARLEYYDSEKKYKARSPPKRAILLRSCFNINRRSDTKHKCVIALHMKDDCFCMLLDAEAELTQWLRALLALQRGGDDENDTGEAPRPTFEHVWQVIVKKRGLGASRNISGRYHLCLNDNTLSLVRIGGGSNSNSTTNTNAAFNETATNQHPPLQHRASSQSIQPQPEELIEFPLIYIKSTGALESFFYMEVGRSAVTGAGELWMLSDDPNIAQNMNSIIQSAMKNMKAKDDLGPKSRNRSSSANESSKPIFMQQRRQTHAGKPMNFSPNSVDVPPTQQFGSASKSQASKESHHSPTSTRHGTAATTGRERCDSLPSRARTASESGSVTHANSVSQQQQRAMSHRSHTLHTRGLSYSPPGAAVSGSPVMSPPSGACSTDSAGSSLSIDETDCCGHSLLEDGVGLTSRFIVPPETQVIPEETPDECWTGVDGFEEDYVNTRIAGLRLPLSDTSGVGTSCSAGTSPADRLVESGPYVPMSPGTAGTSPPHYRHSRTSSIAEDAPVDYRYVGCGGTSSSASGAADSGYVPMSGNGGGDFSYVPIAANPPLDYADMEPARPASRASVTSGTPSTDLRFSEYHLEKVTSYFAPSSDDEDSSSSRPVRAYSVGSRPELVARKNHLDALNAEQTANNQSNASRIRAFSVGSRSKLQQQQAARQSHYHMQCHHPHTHIMHHGAVHNQHSRKASSAPLLSTSWGERTGRTLHGSVEPMDDLMEIDFTRTNKSPVSINTCSGGINIKRRHLKDEGYVDMASKNSSANGYVEMRPLVSSSPPDVMSSPDVVDGYMDMTPGNTGNVNASSTQIPSRQRNSSAPSTSPLQPNCISSPRGLSLPQNIKQYTGRQNNPQQDYINMSASSPRQENRTQPVDLPRKRSQGTPEGYVEMSWNGGRKNTSQLPGSADDYISMSFDKVYKKYQKNLKNHDTISAHSSQPITIRSNQTDSSPKPPPGYLPLVVGSNSTTRQRRESKDSGVVTPSGSQNTIFPFSPSSPTKAFMPNKLYNQRKCQVDASSGTVCLDDANEDDIKPQTTVEPITEKDEKNLHNNCSDTSTSGNDSDYINCSPVRRMSDPSGDYALMLTPTVVTGDTAITTIVQSEASSAEFRPIHAAPESVNSTRKVPEVSSPKNVSNAQNRLLFERRADITSNNNNNINNNNNNNTNQQQQHKEQLEGSAGYELLAVRPSSAGGERIVSRPGSVGGERELHYASLDLPPEAERSPRCPDAPLSASPSPNPEPAFTYAQIDFLKSENLKVKH